MSHEGLRLAVERDNGSNWRTTLFHSIEHVPWIDALPSIHVLIRKNALATSIQRSLNVKGPQQTGYIEEYDVLSQDSSRAYPEKQALASSRKRMAGRLLTDGHSQKLQARACG